MELLEAISPGFFTVLVILLIVPLSEAALSISFNYYLKNYLDDNMQVFGQYRVLRLLIMQLGSAAGQALAVSSFPRRI